MFVCNSKRSDCDIHGFTVLELLIVLAIVGLLASAALSSFSMARKKAQNSRQVVMTKEVQDALEKFSIDNGEYPNGNNIFSLHVSAAITSASGEKAEKFRNALAPYISNIETKLPLTVYPEIKWEYYSAPPTPLGAGPIYCAGGITGYFFASYMVSNDNPVALNDVGPAPERYEVRSGTFFSYICNQGDGWHYWTTI